MTCLLRSNHNKVSVQTTRILMQVLTSNVVIQATYLDTEIVFERKAVKGTETDLHQANASSVCAQPLLQHFSLSWLRSDLIRHIFPLCAVQNQNIGLASYVWGLQVKCGEAESARVRGYYKSADADRIFPL